MRYKEREQLQRPVVPNVINRPGLNLVLNSSPTDVESGHHPNASVLLYYKGHDLLDPYCLIVHVYALLVVNFKSLSLSWHEALF